MTQRAGWGRKNMQGRDAGSGYGKLDHQFFFSIHFDLRDSTVSVSCYLGHLQRKKTTAHVKCEKQLKFPISKSETWQQDKNCFTAEMLNISTKFIVDI